MREVAGEYNTAKIFTEADAGGNLNLEKQKKNGVSGM